MPATDEVWRLQRTKDPDCVLFRRMVRGHDQPSRTTMQGFYVFSPGGARLGARNSRNPDAIARMLGQALQRWEELPAAQRKLPKGTRITPNHRWENNYPEAGLVLMGTVRDVPRSADPKRRRRSPFNRNPVWFSRAEARQWLPQEPTVGARHPLPGMLVERLARLHLVDTVGGQSLPFSRAQVAGSKISAEVVARDGDVVILRIRGRTQAEASGQSRWPREMRTRLVGRARYDLGKERFVQFDLVALGVRTGRTEFNGRRRNPGPSRVGFLFRLAPAGWRVPPGFVRHYGVDWVKR